MSNSAQKVQSEPGDVPPETNSVQSSLNRASIDGNDGSFNSDNNNPNRILCYTGMLKLNHIEDIVVIATNLSMYCMVSNFCNVKFS